MQVEELKTKQKLAQTNKVPLTPAKITMQPKKKKITFTQNVKEVVRNGKLKNRRWWIEEGNFSRNIKKNCGITKDHRAIRTRLFAFFFTSYKNNLNKTKNYFL